ncbi:hypothetical protein [Phenylobacterium sp.]|uniref:hypothetical protein n=1 Tax=Phenylobacterium sp. TaxID=1871053 RepID=UPI00301BAEB8
MAELGTEPVREVQVLRLQPGDAVYVETPAELDVDQAMVIAAGVRDWLIKAGHPRVPVLLLSRGHQLRRIAVDEARALAAQDATAQVFVIGGEP